MLLNRGLILLTALLALSFFGNVGAQQPAEKKEKPKEFPDFAEIVTEEFTKTEGFYNIYKHQEKQIAYLEIPAGTLEQDFLMAFSIAGGSIYTGFQWGDGLLYWKRYDKQLALLERQVQYRAGNPSSPLGQSVTRTYKDTLLTTYSIVTLNGGNPVINLADITLHSVGTFFGRWFQVGDTDLAQYVKLKAFPQNVEIAFEFPDPWGNFVTLHCSIHNLPASSDYQPRKADDRIGYFLTVHKDLTDGKSEENYFVRYVNRWNLKKQDPELKKSPVVKPIIFYIEKTVPVKLRNAVREGILEWNKAFEKVGYLDAIVVRQQTDTNEFKDLDPEDSRYNFFRWISSEMAFAMGPSRVDPRSGEILDADILFDGSYIRYSLMEYDQLIREGSTSSMSPRHLEYLKKNPHRHPMASINRWPGTVEGEDTLHKTDQLIRKAMDEKRAQHQHEFCMIEKGKAHEMNMAALYFATLREIMNDRKEGEEGGETPAEKKDDYPEEFINQVVKDIVMHEVGHTLGLRHNFKASSWKSLKEINSNPAPEALAASVMDYNPTNIKSPKKDAIQGNYQMKTIGPYDYWVIEYGYTPETDEQKLAEIASQSSKPEHVYGTDEDVSSADPFIQRWELGNDPIAFAKHRIEIADAIRKDIVKRSMKKGDSFYNFTKTFGMVLYEYYRAGNTALNYLAGEEVNRDHFGDPNGRDPVVLVPAEKQREALRFVCENLLSATAFSFKPEELTKLAPNNWSHWGSGGWFKEHSFDVYERVLRVQSWLLYDIFNGEIFQRLYNQELKTKEANPLTLPEMFASLRNAVWSELDSAPKETPTHATPWIHGYRRNLQRVHLEELIEFAMDGSGWNPPAVITLAWLELKELKAKIDNARSATNLEKDAYTRSHLEESSKRIQKALDAAYSLNKKPAFGGGFFIIIGEQPESGEQK